MIAAMVISMITADDAPIPIWFRVERVGIHERRGQFGRSAWAASGQRDDKVVTLDRQVREDHEGRQERRAQKRDDDPAIKVPVRCTINLRGLHDLAVDAAQAGQEHCHDKAAGLPNGGQHDRVDCEVSVLDPAKFKALPAPKMHRVFKADTWIKEPLPCGAGHDEAQRHRIEINRAQ